VGGRGATHQRSIGGRPGVWEASGSGAVTSVVHGDAEREVMDVAWWPGCAAPSSQWPGSAAPGMRRTSSCWWSDAMSPRLAPSYSACMNAQVDAGGHLHH
jgi:hypothetical protein